MARKRTDIGTVRYHQGGWELRIHHGGKRLTKRVKGPDSRAGRRQAEIALERWVEQVGLGIDGMTVASLLER